MDKIVIGRNGASETLTGIKQPGPLRDPVLEVERRDLARSGAGEPGECPA